VQVTAATLSQVAFHRLASRTAALTTSTVTNRSGTVTTRATVVSSTITIPAKGGTNALPAAPAFPMGGPAWQAATAVAAAVATALSTAGNLLALCWFGMWMGMTSRSANLATLKTILFVQVIPWFALSFVTGVLAAVLMSALAFRGGPAAMAGWMVWWPLVGVVATATLTVAKDIGFIVWSRNKLRCSCRVSAALSAQR